jgi:intracellular sulfur oxidation DsrE/DsrF family protein
MTSRKDFLIATSAIAALTPGAALAAAPTPAATATPAEPPRFAFDRAAFDTVVNRSAKHRHSFASRVIEDGLVLGTIKNVLDAYENSLDEKPASVTSAAVLYHGYSVLLAFNDGIWNELIIPAAKKMTSTPALADVAKMSVGDGNPYLHKPKDGSYDDSIETLAGRGAYFMACNNAVDGMADAIARALKITPAAAYAQIVGGLVPNGLLVPAGVWAIHALQEAHFTYQQINL